VTSNNTAIVKSPVIRRADLGVTVSDFPDPVKAGHHLHYTIVVTNDGPSNAKKAKVTDHTPKHTVFISLFAPAGWNCTTPGFGEHGLIRCTAPVFAAGDSDLIHITVRVKHGTEGGTHVHDTVHVHSPTPDPNLGNQADSTTTVVKKP